MRMCFPSMQQITLGKFHLSRNLTAMSKNLSWSVTVKNEKARERKDCSVKKIREKHSHVLNITF